MHLDAGPTGCQVMNHLTIKPNSHMKENPTKRKMEKFEKQRKSNMKVYNNKHIGLKQGFHQILKVAQNNFFPTPQKSKKLCN